MVSPKVLIGSLIVLVIVLVTLAACGGSGGPPQDVIERASAAAGDVTSYHFIMSVTLSVEEAGEIDVAEGEGDYLAPDRVWVRGMPGEEQIIIGRNLYRRGSESSEWRVVEIPEGTPPGMGYASMMDPQANLEFLTSPDEGVVWLPDEVIDGVDTWHYRRTVDIVEHMGLIERMEGETDPEEKEWWQEVIDLTRERETTLEFETWIGKEDYLVRQTRSAQSVKALYSDDPFDIAIPEGATYTITWTMKLSKFDEAVEIEAPF